MSKGVFIALEGGEGSGKDTQIDLLKNRLDPKTTVFTREPGGTEVGEKLRAFLLDPSTDIASETELLIFLSARAVLMEKVIRPALAEGKLVISNRFGLSTIAYQIYGRRRKRLLWVLQRFSEKIVGAHLPHYILLDVDPKLGLERVAKRGDGLTRFDAEKLAFHERVRIGYLEHYCDGAASTRIDASQAISAVHEHILDIINAWCS